MAVKQAAKETGALQAAKNKLEKQVEELTWRLQLEKRMRVVISCVKFNPGYYEYICFFTDKKKLNPGYFNSAVIWDISFPVVSLACFKYHTIFF